MANWGVREGEIRGEKNSFKAFFRGRKGKEGAWFFNKKRGYFEREVETLQEKRVV